MKLKTLLLTSFIATLALLNSHAQPPGMQQPGNPAMNGPRFGGFMSTLFQANSAFSATLEFHTTTPSGAAITMPGKLELQDDKSRFEMDMGTVQGVSIPPPAIARMKQMGMDKMTMISRPDLKVTYLLYPGVHGYIENPVPDSDASAPASDFKVDITKLGDETVDGHPCEKNKVVAIDKQGKAHESTVWNATDLKKFPVKIETSEGGSACTMIFKDIKMDKPADSDFDAPSDFKKYNSMMEMMMSQMRGGG